MTGVVRLQTERQHITNGESFRRRTKSALQDIERAAAAAGYDPQDVADTHFAVIAFLDSVVLNSNDPVRAEWERKTLQEELFGGADAGIVFFEKLEKFHTRRDSEQVADILEVFLLCLLLGFEGRFAGGMQGERDRIVERLEKRIESIRGRSARISAAGILPPESLTPPPAPQYSSHFRTAAYVSAGFTILFYLALYWNLWSITDRLRMKLF